MLGQVAALCALDSEDRRILPDALSRLTSAQGKSWSQLAAAKGVRGPVVDLVRRMLHVNP